MRELVTYSGDIRQPRTPRSLGELYGYFMAKEQADPHRYKGYSATAATVTASIEAVRDRRHDDEPVAVDLALMPGVISSVHLDDLTRPGRELIELVFVANALEPISDETSDTHPYGRTLWQNPGYGLPINLIETRGIDRLGETIRLTVVSDVPLDLLHAQPATREYTSKELRAIKISQALQTFGRRNRREASDAQIDYFNMISTWPVTKWGIPEEERDSPLTQ